MTYKATMLRSAVLLVCAFLVVTAVSFAGSVATTPKLAGWYAQLAKPSFTPPNYVFPFAWTTLYVLMAISLWRIFVSPASAARTRSVSLFAAQLAANVAWPWVFFHFESLKGGLVAIVLLAVLIAATLWETRRVSILAAWLLVPYLAWVLFAALLNAEIARMNG